MFFELSKLAWFVVAPSNLIFLLLVGAAVALLLRRTRLGRAGLVLGLALLGMAGLGPVGRWLILPLEERFPVWQGRDAPTGVIVLGGSFDIEVSARRGQVALNESAERLTEAVALARRFPQARLVFTGGNGTLTRVAGNESDDAARLFREMGLARTDIVFERESRNT